MTDALYVATSGALVQQIRLEILANNLANSNTAGFKEDEAVFTAYLNNALTAPGEPPLPGTNYSQTGPPLPLTTPADYLVTLENIQTDFSSGPAKYTGNPLDLTLQGNGFFSVQGPGKTLYTRKGSLTINREGLLSTQDGLPIIGDRGPIRLDGPNFTIDQEGNILVAGAAVDRIKVVDFPQPYSLTKVGDTLFALEDVTVEATKPERMELMQGYVEGSNVDAVRTMTEMIEVLRAYESYQKVIQSVDEINAKAIEEVGTIG